MVCTCRGVSEPLLAQHIEVGAKVFAKLPGADERLLYSSVAKYGTKNQAVLSICFKDDWAPRLCNAEGIALGLIAALNDGGFFPNSRRRSVVDVFAVQGSVVVKGKEHAGFTALGGAEVQLGKVSVMQEGSGFPIPFGVDLVHQSCRICGQIMAAENNFAEPVAVDVPLRCRKKSDVLTSLTRCQKFPV